MSIQWKYSSPVEESEILAVAKKHNISLPNYLIQMIMVGNNGSPSPKKFFYEGGKNEDVFKTLLSYNPHDVENVYSALDELKEMPSLYPFGNDPAGNFICLNGTKVVLWKHEINQAVPVSDSVQLFFEGLH
ncbi:MAG: SMI1/KNR4 family protein [Muribaculaceae bacterium]|nr:SMI1/KNR4 family protein [Muribaculaceae bacterium]